MNPALFAIGYFLHFSWGSRAQGPPTPACQVAVISGTFHQVWSYNEIYSTDQMKAEKVEREGEIEREREKERDLFQ
jgi:hypothetical protein